MKNSLILIFLVSSLLGTGVVHAAPSCEDIFQPKASANFNPLSSNLYKRLGLEPGANEADIKHAYRTAAMEYHPDRNNGYPESYFKNIQEAYEILKKDPSYAGTAEEFNGSKEDFQGESFNPRHSRRTSDNADGVNYASDRQLKIWLEHHWNSAKDRSKSSPSPYRQMKNPELYEVIQKIIKRTDNLSGTHVGQALHELGIRIEPQLLMEYLATTLPKSPQQTSTSAGSYWYIHLAAMGDLIKIYQSNRSLVEIPAFLESYATQTDSPFIVYGMIKEIQKIKTPESTRLLIAIANNPRDWTSGTGRALTEYTRQIRLSAQEALEGREIPPDLMPSPYRDRK